MEERRFRLSDLKRIRVAVSLAFLAAAALPFLDYTGSIPHRAIQWLFALQFVPALSESVAEGGAVLAGLTFILLLTLAFGRVYCSSICPLGTLQDIISSIRRKAHRHRWYDEEPPRTALRLSLLGLSILSFLSGGMYVVSLLDPFSNFGRVVSGLARPVVLVVNNTAAYVFERAGLYWVYPLDIKAVTVLSLLPPLFLLALVAWLAWTRGRLYCNTVCPVGTLLGLVSRAAVYRITISADECTGCGLCGRVCKAGCIDGERKTVDMSRCVNCFNCFPECPTEGITYTRSFRRHTAQETDGTRRDLLLGSFVWLAGLAGVPPGKARTIIAKKESTVPVARLRPVTPPGAGGIRRFTETCTACHLCVSACPTGVLVPSFLDYGMTGILQPQMDYRSSFCNFDCTICTGVCPTGALLPLESPVKKLTQLGAARFVRDNCIVFTEETECGACSEHCPTKAVTMVPYKRLMAPEVRNEYCIGCGACEYACPTRPWKAIYVNGRDVHSTAQPPPKELKEKPSPVGEDFPF